LFTDLAVHDKHEKMKLPIRLALCVLFSVSFTSCGTLGGFMNSLPVRMLDEAGSTFMGFFAENNSSAIKTPEALQTRGRKVESHGSYVGRVGGNAALPQNMAAR